MNKFIKFFSKKYILISLFSIAIVGSSLVAIHISKQDNQQLTQNQLIDDSLSQDDYVISLFDEIEKHITYVSNMLDELFESDTLLTNELDELLNSLDQLYLELQLTTEISNTEEMISTLETLKSKITELDNRIVTNYQFDSFVELDLEQEDVASNNNDTSDNSSNQNSDSSTNNDSSSNSESDNSSSNDSTHECQWYENVIIIEKEVNITTPIKEVTVYANFKHANDGDGYLMKLYTYISGGENDGEITNRYATNDDISAYSKDLMMQGISSQWVSYYEYNHLGYHYETIPAVTETQYICSKCGAIKDQ